MANLNEAFKTYKPYLKSTKEDEYTIVNQYDTRCPKCGNEGYCATNDGGSMGGCLKCNITYKSKIKSKKKVKYWSPKDEKIKFSEKKYYPLPDEFFRR